MKLSGEGKLLRIFLGEQDKIGHQPMYEALVLKAREMGLAGATVVRGVQGFGAASRVIHSAKILRLSEDLPMVVEVVDTDEQIRQFLSVVDAMFASSGGGGLVTLEPLEIIKYTHGI
jgi:PII-like signaling protein